MSRKTLQLCVYILDLAFVYNLTGL